MTANFDAAYGTIMAKPVWPTIEEILMMRPDFCEMRCGTTARVVRKTPRRLMSRPMPRTPPVMMTTRFPRSPIALLLLLVLRGCSNRRDSRVVRAEEVVRVVLRLDTRDAVIALRAAVGVDEAVGLVEVEHVGVDAGAEPRLECVAGGTDLGDVACV